MKRFVFYIGAIIVLVLCCVAVVNYIIDPGHIYSEDYIDEIIYGIKDGQNVEGVKNINERLYKKKLIEANTGRGYDYIALGSSRIMTASEDAFDGETLLNLGVSGCKFEDMIALYQLCLNNNIKFNNVLIAVDPTFFNEFDDDTRWLAIKQFYYEFMGVDYDEGIDLNYLENLFSPSYFQSSISAIPGVVTGKTKLEYVQTVENDGFTNRIDGSIYYDKKFREVSQNAIDKGALIYKHGSYNHFDTISPGRVSLFEKLICKMKSDNLNVIFFQAPYHPLFYQNVLQIKGVVSAIDYVNKYAIENNIKVIGSFNPNVVGFKNTDFYDAHHARKESIDRLIKTSLE